MKTLLTLALCSALLSLSGCKKVCLTPDGSDITSAMKHGYLYNTWIIDDDNAGNHNSTQNGNTFKDKKDPEILIQKNNTYVLTYTSAKSNLFISEAGSCNVDANAKTITFHPSGKSDYTYKISVLTQENFTLIATYDQTTYIKNAEGILVPQTQHIDETLFMEDND